MNTKKNKSLALRFLESKTGGALTLGEMLETIRRCEDLTQVAMAKQLGITRSHLCDIEKGRKTISPARAAKFANILGHSQSQFVRLALQAQVNQAGLKLEVQVCKA